MAVRRITPTIKNSKALPKGPKLPSMKTPSVKVPAQKNYNPKQPKMSVSKGLLGYLGGTKYPAPGSLTDFQ